MTAVREAFGAPTERYSPARERSVASVFWRSRRLLITVPVFSGIVGLVVLIFLPNQYTSTTSFIPASKGTSGMGNLAELAAVAGVAGASTANPSSPQFYQEILSSTPIVYEVLKTSFVAPRRGYDVPKGAESIKLFEVLSSPGKSEAERLADASSKLLRHCLSTDLDRRTGIVSVSVTLNDPVLAASVAGEFVKQVGLFNRNTLQTQARARREFAQTQADQAGRELATAEDALQRFLQGNRQWRDSPSLTFEQEKLQRQVSLNQDLYLSLRHDLDQARLSEVDDTPTITVIEPALVPVRKSGPHRLLSVIIIMIVAALTTGAAIAGWDLRRRLIPELEGI